MGRPYFTASSTVAASLLRKNGFPSSATNFAPHPEKCVRFPFTYVTSAASPSKTIDPTLTVLPPELRITRRWVSPSVTRSTVSSGVSVTSSMLLASGVASAVGSWGISTVVKLTGRAAGHVSVRQYQARRRRLMSLLSGT